MNVLVFILTLIFSSTGCHKCDIRVLVSTEETVDSLQVNDVVAFFCTIDESCEDAAEFVEYTDELMFRVINAQPAFTLQALGNTPSGDLELILKKISDPHESADIELAYRKISQVHGHDKVKKQILTAIQIAIDKNKVK